jgi:hypothetical protein
MPRVTPRHFEKGLSSRLSGVIVTPALPPLLCWQPMEPIEKVRLELQRYEHPLLDFSARDNDGSIELVIDLKQKPPGIHTYYLPLHPRDLESTQFAWTLQRMIFDGLHDYFIEMFVYTPQSRDNPSSPA